MSNQVYDDWILSRYRKTVAEQFRMQFSRKAKDDKELMAYALASFLLDQGNQANAVLHALAGYTGAVMRMWLPDGEELDKLKALECLIEAFALIIQVGVQEAVTIEEEKKRIEEELKKQQDVRMVEALTKRLNEIMLKKN